VAIRMAGEIFDGHLENMIAYSQVTFAAPDFLIALLFVWQMVCDACEKKLGKLCVPDKWKEGSRNVTGGKDGGRVPTSSGPSASLNKLSEKRKARLAEAGGGLGRQCRICKVRIMDVQRHYCNGCAYKVNVGRAGGRANIRRRQARSRDTSQAHTSLLKHDTESNLCHVREKGRRHKALQNEQQMKWQDLSFRASKVSFNDSTPGCSTCTVLLIDFHL